MTKEIINTGFPANLRNPTAYQVAKAFVLSDRDCKALNRLTETLTDALSDKEDTFMRWEDNTSIQYAEASNRRHTSVMAMYSLAEIDSDIKSFLRNNQFSDWDKMRKLYRHFKAQELSDKIKTYQKPSK
jgi:hypothetical protein